MLDGKDLRIIQNLYWNQRAAVRIAGDRSEWQDIRWGVRQGNIYSDVILKKLEGTAGAKVGGNNLNNLKYADDTAMIANSQKIAGPGEYIRTGKWFQSFEGKRLQDMVISCLKHKNSGPS